MSSPELKKWVEEMAGLCAPEGVVWCDGSEAERERLTAQAVASGEIVQLDPLKRPNSYFHRSAANDVARTEHLTFICTARKEDAGPTNNWMAPSDAYAKLGAIFRGSMRGRTMYVVPFLMGPPGSPHSKVGVQLTDSLYVVLNMRIMTHMGAVATKELARQGAFTKCLHGEADLSEERRFICHFPEDNAIWSVGSGYGGNALLGKKCLALRIGSWLGRSEGWLAEHMLILGIESPDGQVRYIAAAFPSQCGKTNLAMLTPPPSLKKYRIWTVGDDIAWLWPDNEGRLRAVNPEHGFFGSLPGTNDKTNPNAMVTIRKNTIFTNALLTPDRDVWWEGLGDPPPQGVNWQGHPWTPSSKEKGAHPNSRYTAPIAQCPSASPKRDDPAGVPISAIVFGGRSARRVPLVYQSRDWAHGVYLGATMSSEATAASENSAGQLRRDPMGMLPFCGYHMGDYFSHWLEMGRKLTKAPKIFHVNWFRRDASGRFLWPGFGENLRALLWMLDRVEGKGGAVETPVGFVPAPGALDLSGLDVPEADMKELFRIDVAEWKAEVENQREFFSKIGPRLPASLENERQALAERLEKT